MSNELLGTFFCSKRAFFRKTLAEQLSDLGLPFHLWEDGIQELGVRLCRHWSTLENAPDNAKLAWCFVVMGNIVADFGRDPQNHHGKHIRLEDDPNFEPRVVHDQTIMGASSGIDIGIDLSETERYIFKAWISGRTHAERAQALNTLTGESISAGTFGKRWTRLRKKARHARDLGACPKEPRANGKSSSST